MDHQHLPQGSTKERLLDAIARGSTWARLIRERGWRRPRLRVHSMRPTVRVRGKRPNEFWHIDVAIIKLLDGTRLYLHAVLDNFSRRILAWRLNDRLAPLATSAVLLEASRDIDRARSPLSCRTEATKT